MTPEEKLARAETLIDQLVAALDKAEDELIKGEKFGATDHFMWVRAQVRRALKLAADWEVFR